MLAQVGQVRVQEPALEDQFPPFKQKAHQSLCVHAGGGTGVEPGFRPEGELDRPGELFPGEPLWPSRDEGEGLMGVK